MEVVHQDDRCCIRLTFILFGKLSLQEKEDEELEDEEEKEATIH